MSLSYRKYFYENYYDKQSGKDFKNNVKVKFVNEQYQFTNEILPYLPAKNKQIEILDLGCGIGSLIAACKSAGYANLTGIDISDQQVELAHELGVTEVIKADIFEYLDQRENAFDLISGMDIIEHFSKVELVKLFELVKKALRKGGMAIFRTPNMDAPMASVFAMGDFTHENFINKNSAEQLMNSMDFKNTEVFPSFMYVKGAFKNLIRRIVWRIISLSIKTILFATGRSSKHVILTPNLVIRAQKK
jgi:2-polyprenyl-3-methyl-5-hydroxy-6-metoxy-1,4-benzoquinol methylase